MRSVAVLTIACLSLLLVGGVTVKRGPSKSDAGVESALGAGFYYYTQQGSESSVVGTYTIPEADTGTIDAFAEGVVDDGVIIVTTAAAHGLTNGWNVKIEGTTNYNGFFDISNVASTTFEIAETWVADEAPATWIYAGQPYDAAWAFIDTEQSNGNPDWSEIADPTLRWTDGTSNSMEICNTASTSVDLICEIGLSLGTIAYHDTECASVHFTAGTDTLGDRPATGADSYGVMNGRIADAWDPNDHLPMPGGTGWSRIFASVETAVTGSETWTVSVVSTTTQGAAPSLTGGLTCDIDTDGNGTTCSFPADSSGTASTVGTRAAFLIEPSGTPTATDMTISACHGNNGTFGAVSLCGGGETVNFYALGLVAGAEGTPGTPGTDEYHQDLIASLHGSTRPFQTVTANVTASAAGGASPCVQGVLKWQKDVCESGSYHSNLHAAYMKCVEN